MLVLVLKVGVLVTVLLVSFSMTAILIGLGSACPLSGSNLLSSNSYCENDSSKWLASAAW